MRSKEFIALSACCMMLTAVGIDIMLPAFGDIRHRFGLDEHSPYTAYIVTSFFWGQIFQVVFGTLSDRYGRIFVLRIGFPLYIAGGIAAAFSDSLFLMFICRFIAGMGASAVFMTTIASVRDKFEGDEMARTMSFIFTIFLFTPIVAPFLGVGILSLFSWRAVFLTPPAFAVIIFFWSLRMEESLPPERRNSGNADELLRLFSRVLTTRSFLRYTAITTLLFGGISAYVSNAEFIVNDIYKKSGLFPWVFGGIGSVMAVGALLNTRLASVFGAKKSIKGLLVAYTLVSIILLLGTYFFGPLPDMYFFFICIAVLLGLNLAAEPNSSALAMKSTGEVAGIASALYGTIFFFTGAIIGSLISYFLSEGVISMSVGFVVIGVTALLLAVNDNDPAGG